jgi:tetratricopeptide (TPR) repeat protein
MARQAESLDAYAEADAYYTRALALHDTYLPADYRGTLDLLLMRSALIERQGKPASYDREIDRMFALATTLGEPELLAISHLHHANYLSAIGRSAEALRAGEAALAIYHANQDKTGEIQALRELGMICWTAQQYGDALRYGREVLLLHRQQSDVSGEASALHNLGEIYRSLGSPRQAITFYEEALQLYWTRRDHRLQALTLYSLAYANRQIADFDTALRHYHQARTFCERMGDRLILSRICHALAILHWEMGQGEAAVQAMSEAVGMSRTTGYLPGIAYGLVAQGFMEAQQERRATAIELWQAAVATLLLIGDEEGVREVEARINILVDGAGELPELPPTLQWVRSHVILTEGKVYCEFEFPAIIARGL